MSVVGYESLVCFVSRVSLIVFAEKVELVKNVIVNLARNIESGRNIHEWENLPIESYLQKDEEVKAVSGLSFWECVVDMHTAYSHRLMPPINRSIHDSSTSLKPEKSES